MMDLLYDDDIVTFLREVDETNDDLFSLDYYNSRHELIERMKQVYTSYPHIGGVSTEIFTSAIGKWPPRLTEYYLSRSFYSYPHWYYLCIYLDWCPHHTGLEEFSALKGVLDGVPQFDQNLVDYILFDYLVPVLKIQLK
jgi:hypothetical protein